MIRILYIYIANNRWAHKTAVWWGLIINSDAQWNLAVARSMFVVLSKSAWRSGIRAMGHMMGGLRYWCVYELPCLLLYCTFFVQKRRTCYYQKIWLFARKYFFSVTFIADEYNDNNIIDYFIFLFLNQILWCEVKFTVYTNKIIFSRWTLISSSEARYRPLSTKLN